MRLNISLSQPTTLKQILIDIRAHKARITIAPVLNMEAAKTIPASQGKKLGVT